MNSIHEALSAVEDVFDASGLRPDAAGFIELVITGGLSVFICAKDDEALEFSARIPSMSGQISDQVLAALLAWNAKADLGRIAVEPDRSELVFGHRITIDTVDAAGLRLEVRRYLQALARWNVETAPALLEDAKRQPASTLPQEELSLRL